MCLRALIIAPTVLLLVANPVDALLLAGGLVVAYVVVEWALGWRRR